MKCPRKRRLVSKPQYCTHLFHDGCGNGPYLLYPHLFWMYILFLRSTLIPLRHLLRHFIFLSKTFFLPFTCVHFSIKITNWSLTCCSLSHFPFQMPVLVTGSRETLSSSSSLLLLTTTWWLALVTLVSKYFRLQITFETQRLCGLWALSVWGTQIVRGSKGHIVRVCVCVFAQQCVQAASESASRRAKGRTVHQRIHRTTECFLGGGWDSERECSKKSLSNYLQLWACYCAISHTFFFFFCGAGCDHKCYQIKSATVTWIWFELLQIVNVEWSDGCERVLGGSVGVGELRLWRPGLKPA